MLEKELQNHIDVAKWFLSEKKRYDMCGKYDYCSFCNMNSENPCAKAVLKMNGDKKTNILLKANELQNKIINIDEIKNAKTKTYIDNAVMGISDAQNNKGSNLESACQHIESKSTKSTKEPKKNKTQLDENGYPTNVTVRSFKEKLIESDKVLQDRYIEIQKELLSYNKVNHRVSNKCDNYRSGRGNLIAKITIVSKSLRLNFPLDPNDEKYVGRKFPHNDLGNKKTYADAPFQFKITSNLSVKRCIALIADVAQQKNIEKKTLN